MPTLKYSTVSDFTLNPPTPWKLVWQDTFDGPAGALPDPSKWNIETGPIGNGMLQSYTRNPKNVHLNGKGELEITAYREFMPNGRTYSSGRINTADKFSFQYGRIDVTAKVTSTRGASSAIWMLGDNISKGAVAKWPECGEIDIHECPGGSTPTAPSIGDEFVYGSAHWGDITGAHAKTQGLAKVPGDRLKSEMFHKYSVIWDKQSIQWLVDNRVYGSLDITGPEFTEFHQPFFPILNVGVGGPWPTSVNKLPTADSPYPATMTVTEVSVYQPLI